MSLSRKIFEAPTQYYKAGVVFLAWLNGHQDHFTMPAGLQSARGILHYSDVFRLADQADVLVREEGVRPQSGDERGELIGVRADIAERAALLWILPPGRLFLAFGLDGVAEPARATMMSRPVQNVHASGKDAVVTVRIPPGMPAGRIVVHMPSRCACVRARRPRPIRPRPARPSAGQCALRKDPGWRHRIRASRPDRRRPA